MSASQDSRATTVSTTGYVDGLGRRTIRFDREIGTTLECLQVRPELAVYERALQDQSAILTTLDDERVLRVTSVKREGGRLVVISELIAGDRLSDIIEARAAGDAAVSGLDAAFGFLLQILPALSALHAASLVHGAIAPGRIILTANSRVVLADAIYGSALPRLNLSRRRLWSELGVAAPPSAGIIRFDAAADVAQASLCGLMLALGRTVQAADPIDVLPHLVSEAVEIAQIRGGDRLGESIRQFFTATLPLAGIRSAVTADQAAADAQAIAGSELGDDACLNALSDFVRYEAPPAPVPVPRKIVVAPPRPKPAPPPPPVVRVPEPEPEEEAFEEDTVEFEPEPASVAFVPPVAVAPPIVPTPAVVVAAAPVAPVVAPAPPIVAAPPPPPPPPVEAPVAPPPLITRRGQWEIVQPEPAPVPLIPLPEAAQPAHAHRTPAPVPVGRAVVTPNPAVFAPPPPPAPIRVAAAAPEPPPAAAPVKVKLKAEPPAGYAPVRSAPNVNPYDADPRGPFAQHGAPAEATAFPWKLAAAAVLLVAVAVVGGRSYLLGKSEREDSAAPPPVVAKSRPVPVPATTSVAAGSTGTLTIETQPAGARVLLDGTAAGETPLKLEGLPAGRHTVTLITPEATVKRTVRVDAGKSVVLDVPMFSGWVAIYAPIPLEISEGNRGLGSTDQGRIMLPPGRHALTVSNQALGYSESHTVEIVAGEQSTINLTPTTRLNVNAQPWAEVFLNGTRLGETPLANLEVPLGTHEFLFKHPQYGERKVTTTIIKNPPALIVDFTKAGF